MSDRPRYLGPPALFRLLWGGLRLHQPTYEEVTRSREATPLSIAVAMVAGIATGLDLSAAADIIAGLGMAIGATVTVARAAMDALLVWGIGRALLGRSATYGEMLRPIAVASAPGVLYLIAAAIPELPGLHILISLWLLIAFILAIRVALGIGWLAGIGIALLLHLLNLLLYQATQLL